MNQAPKLYDQSDQNRTRDELERDMAMMFRKGGTTEIAGGRLVLTDTVTGTRYELTVASGVLTITATTL